MAYVASFFSERFVAKQIQAMVDETEIQLLKRGKLIDKYFPTQMFDGRDFVGLLTKRVAPAASIVAYGAEIPLVSFGGVERMAATLFKLGTSRLYDEEAQWKMMEAQNLAITKGIKVQKVYNPDGTVTPGSNPDLATILFGQMNDLLRGITDRMDHLKWQVVQTGAVDMTDPRTGIPLSLDFKKPGVNYNHFPAPLTQTGNTVTPTLNKWSDYANAQALQNLSDACDTYYDTNGYMPDKIVMSRKLWKDFLQQRSTRDAARQMSTVELGLVSPDMGRKLLAMRDLPEVEVFEEKYQEQLPDGSIVDVNLLNNNRFVFLKEDMGISAIGPTLESVPTIVGSGDAPIEPKSGIYMTTYEQNKHPKQDVSMATATFLPIAMNPKQLYSQQVK
jgi:hypothetical protein